MRIDTGFVSRTAMTFSTGRITGNTKIRVTRKVTRSIIWSVMRNTEQRGEKRGDMSVMQIYKMTSTGGAKRKE